MWILGIILKFCIILSLSCINLLSSARRICGTSRHMNFRVSFKLLPRRYCCNIYRQRMVKYISHMYSLFDVVNLFFSFPQVRTKSWIGVRACSCVMRRTKRHSNAQEALGSYEYKL